MITGSGEAWKIPADLPGHGSDRAGGLKRAPAVKLVALGAALVSVKIRPDLGRPRMKIHFI
jgi:hypothetical protein